MNWLGSCSSKSLPVTNMGLLMKHLRSGFIVVRLTFKRGSIAGNGLFQPSRFGQTVSQALVGQRLTLLKGHLQLAGITQVAFPGETLCL